MKIDYPKILVFLQFSFIFLLVILSFNSFTLLRVGLFLIGAVIGLIALQYNRRHNFYIRPILKEGAKLVTTGIYRYVRHPMYLSVAIMMGAFVKDRVTFLIWLALIGVLYLKAKNEERLWCNSSRAYIEYKNRTKSIIPFIL